MKTQARIDITLSIEKIYKNGIKKIKANL